MINDSLPGLGFDGETVAGPMANDPHHPGRVTLHPFFRLTDKADNALLQVIDAAGVVNDGMIFYLVEEAVDG